MEGTQKTTLIRVYIFIALGIQVSEGFKLLSRSHTEGVLQEEQQGSEGGDADISCVRICY